MAGHEHSQVRPQAPQDRRQIAAGSPIAVQGIFLEIIRERFRGDSGIDWVWRPDITETDIVIEGSFNEETESRNTTPAVYITRLETTAAKIVIGDRAGVRLPDHKEGFGALATVGMQVECVSNDEGESSVLGDIVQFMLLASQDIIQREFGFYDFTHPSLSQTTAYARDVNKWSTVVSFQVQFWIRWSQVPIAPLLQQIVQRVTHHGVDSNGYFVDVAINSLRRGDAPCDTPALGDGALPGGSGPPVIIGPPGPPGPPGSAGLPGLTVYLRISQSLTGPIDGLNTVFISSVPFLHDALRQEMFYINGIRQRVGVGNDYVVSESVPSFGYDTITVIYAPKPGDVLLIDFYAGP